MLRAGTILVVISSMLRGVHSMPEKKKEAENQSGAKERQFIAKKTQKTYLKQRTWLRCWNLKGGPA